MLIDICKYLFGAFAGIVVSALVVLQFLRTAATALALDAVSEQS